MVLLPPPILLVFYFSIRRWGGYERASLRAPGRRHFRVDCRLLLVLQSGPKSGPQTRDKLQGSVATYLRCVGHAREVHETTTLLLVTLPNIHPFKKSFHFFTCRLSSKPFLIWLLTTPPHLKCVATLPCNLSLIACFLILLFHKVG